MRASKSAHHKQSNLEADGSVTIADDADSKNDTSAEIEVFEEKIRRKIRELWPNKTVQHLSIVGNVMVRNAARILSREQGISAYVLRCLTNSEKGAAFLAIQQENCGWRFWKEMRNAHGLAEIARKKRELAEEERQYLEGT